MIGKLTGVVDTIEPGGAIIDVSGVGYRVHCSGRTLARFAIGASVSLVIETQVRDEVILLYGFSGADERTWFRLLTSVQGVGAKVALAILSVLEPHDLAPAVAAADRAAFGQAPGVGPKLAQRIINELKDKVGLLPLGPAAGGAIGVAGIGAGGTGAPASDAVSALANLGYSRAEAFSAVSHAAAELGNDAKVEALVRAALARMAPKELGA